MLMCATGFREGFRSMPKFVQRNIVQKYQGRIETENELLTPSEVDKLSVRQLQDALYLRGEDVLPIDDKWEKLALYMPNNGRELPYGSNLNEGELKARLLKHLKD